MNHTATYPLQHPRSYKGGDRYFFNGQEVDNEMLGEGALHAFEYRMHDTRIGRFWSVDPLAGKFPRNSMYAFAENSPVGCLGFEGIEKVRFGSKVENFTGMTKEEVKNTLNRYCNYHYGNVSVSEIMSSSNDNGFWDVTDMKNDYLCG